MAKYTIREANDDDIRGIAKLRLRIKEFQLTGEDEYVQFWESFIKDNPCSIKKVFIALNEQNRVIAHFALVPFKFRKDEKLLLAGFVCELMVDEDYRQELLFPKMLLRMIKEYKGIGVDFLYSLSNRSEVVKAYRSFGFRIIGELAVYARPYKLAGIAQHFIKSNILNMLMKPVLFIANKVLHLRKSSYEAGLEPIEISRFDSSVNQFISEVQMHYPYCILRNADILNWRTVDSPSRKYSIFIIKEDGNIIGYMVLRCMKMKQFDVLVIVDILFSPDRFDAGRALLNTAHETALQSGVDMSTCLFSSHDPLLPIFKKCGYFKSPETFSLFLHEPKGSNLQFIEGSFDKWHLTWFDHDSA